MSIHVETIVVKRESKQRSSKYCQTSQPFFDVSFSSVTRPSRWSKHLGWLNWFARCHPVPSYLQQGTPLSKCLLEVLYLYIYKCVLFFLRLCAFVGKTCKHHFATVRRNSHMLKLILAVVSLSVSRLVLHFDLDLIHFDCSIHACSI